MVDADPPVPNAIVPPPPSLILTSNLLMLYYSLVVVGTAAAVLALYNLVILKYCTNAANHHQSYPRPAIYSLGPSCRSRSFHILSTASFKYKKDDNGNHFECAVCLSEFEEGEELRQLPNCKHSFHAPCIDMWLYSHMDCPLCRSLVEPPFLQRREGLIIDTGALV